ncbi:MAG: bifunctional metallophosphatase/5'-nucleotidase [Candidatus Obscuribacterales bacterium]|nr:bifunctional metallophosphatase/5'-nucleotidase [Candidatus Obscuribacterales bacterium]
MMKPGAKFLASELIITIGLLGSIPFIATDAAKAAQASQENFTITILHSNDLHSHEDSFLEKGRNVGGMSRIAHLIKTTKKNTKNVLAVDAGDIFQGTPYFETYKGQVEVESLNKAGYDIYTIGNHEFDEGSKNLGEKLKLAKFDVISANLDASAVPDLAAIVKPSVIKTIDGQKVAFIGMITPVLNEMAPRLDGVKVTGTGRNWLEPLKAEVAKMKSQGVNKIFVVSHCGVDQEKEMAENIPDIDVVVGGHSHTRLDKPIIVKHDDGSSAFVVQTGCYGRTLGRLDLEFDKDGKLVMPQSKYRLINITDKVFQDADLQSYLNEMGKPFAALATTFIASANGNFDNKFKNHPWDSPIGDLICDALADSGAEYGATIALQNRGGIRGPLEQGPVSIQRVREILPFANRLMVATLKGDALLQVLEKSVSGMLGARFLDVKGLKFAYDPTLETGKRIVFAFAQNKEGQWERIEANGLYRVGVNDFTFGGGEGYEFKDPKDVVDTKLRLSTVMESYLKKKKEVTPEPPSRMMPVSTNIAKLDSGKSKAILIDYPAPGAELNIVKGSGQGVSFMKKIGIVPLMNPSIYQQAKMDDAGQYKIDLAQVAAKSKGETWVSVILKAKDNNGNTTRIASAPIKVQ